MKYLISTLFLLLIFSCSNTKKKYEGYVYFKNTPLTNVTIIEDGISESYTKTNTNGYFSLKKSSENFTRDLIFKKEGYNTDTVRLLRGRTGARIYFLFLREQTDTLFMRKK